jgi:hypothetical protein
MPIVVSPASHGRAFVLGTSVNTPKARALQPGLTMIDVPDAMALADASRSDWTCVRGRPRSMAASSA